MYRTPATMRALTRAVSSSPLGTKSATPSLQFLQRYARHASSSVDPAQRAAGAAATQNASAAASTSHAATAMPWDAYFKLRKSRKNWGTIAAIPTTLTGVFGGGGYFANLQTDPTSTILGLEPIYAYGIAVVGCIALGWLSGPVLGDALWRATHRDVLKKVELMDSRFLGQHVQKRRVDPSRQSVNNPVPDFYGERIFSKKQYKQWLRDQAAYRRKAAFGSQRDGTSAL